MRELEPGAPLSNVATIDELVAESLGQPRSLAMLVGGFALTALALAVFGIYGVMAYFVQQQSKDISIRIALGGTMAGVLRLLVGNGMKLVGIGVAVGLAASLALTRLTGEPAVRACGRRSRRDERASARCCWRSRSVRASSPRSAAPRAAGLDPAQRVGHLSIRHPERSEGPRTRLPRRRSAPSS